MSRLFAVATLLAVSQGCGEQPSTPQQSTALPAVAAMRAEVEEALDGRPFGCHDHLDPLIQRGSSLFPVYEEMLASDRPADLARVHCVVSVLLQVHGDRSRFRPLVLRHVNHPSLEARCMALLLIAEIGTASDAASLHGLLNDPDTSVARGTVRAMAAIGAWRDYDVLVAWLGKLQVLKMTPEPPSICSWMNELQDAVKSMKWRLDATVADG